MNPELHGNRKKIAALLACHNRRELTLACLNDISRQRLPAGYVIDIFVVDDGSTDGTSGAIAADFPNVRIISGDGSLYWGGGMRLAIEIAIPEDYDFYLWLNDDVALHENALSRLLDTFAEQSIRHGTMPVVAGVFSDPDSGQTSYGGWRSISKYFPTRMRRLDAASSAQVCDAANGNYLLIPKAAAKVVGNIDSCFKHRIGDFDYTMRARKSGFPVLTAPGVIGECRPNVALKDRVSEIDGLRNRWRYYTSEKGLPIADWRRFNMRHGGILWPLIFMSPYIRFWLVAIFGIGWRKL